MPTALHPSLVNNRFGDAALYVKMRFARSALLFDIGDISPLSPRQILDIDHVFVSHAHIDHFVGFDRLLRTLVGRDKQVNFWGPPGFAAHVHHKLQAYLWNLAPEFRTNLVFEVTEIGAEGSKRRVTFGLRQGFAPEVCAPAATQEGIVLSEPAFRVRSAVLDHRIPCLGFALEETATANVWKTRLDAMGLPVGPWLKELKQAVLEGRSDEHCIAVPMAVEASTPQRTRPLGDLRALVQVTPGRKIAYATDVADAPANREALISLARDADILFIEAAFAQEDAEIAAERAHLTTRAAGEIARAACVRRIEPFHFSARYKGQEARMRSQVMRAFGEDRSERPDSGVAW